MSFSPENAPARRSKIGVHLKRPRNLPSGGPTLPATTLAQDVTLKFGHASTHLFQDGLAMFADKVAAKTGGKVKLEVYGDRQLGDDKQLLEGVQLGTIDGALVSVPTIPLTLNSSVFDALQLPFLVPSYDKMAEVLFSDVPGARCSASQPVRSIRSRKVPQLGQFHSFAPVKGLCSRDDLLQNG